MTVRRGCLADLFQGVAVKKLTSVETDPERSNQHEFQGVKSLRSMLGPDDLREIPARFVWLSAEQEALSEDGFVSWSNVRKGQLVKKTGRPRSPEYHLYYSSNSVTQIMRSGDTAFFGRLKTGSMLVAIAPATSTMRSQLMWLFGIEDQGELDEYRGIDAATSHDVDFAARFILDELGLEIEDVKAAALDGILAGLKGRFPTTAEFSRLARKSLPQVDPRDDVDAALMAWLEREESLFRRLERMLVSERLRDGFMTGGEADVDGFLAFSLTVQNRRKSRAGYSLEHHLDAIFKAYDLNFSHGAKTDGNATPDFLFPGAAEYRDPAFPAERLTLLGSKSTCKDRWRQVLSEGMRVARKHLMTLEPSISENQTAEMQTHKLQLVLPRRLHETYRPAQRQWLMDLRGFIEHVRARQ